MTALMAAAAAGGCGPATPPVPPGVVAAAVRGHHEVAVLPDGGLEPRFLGGERAIGLCLATTPETDTSQWQATLHLRRTGGESTPPSPAAGVRMETTVCFERPPPPSPASPLRLELCAELRDSFDGRVYSLPCRPLRLEPASPERAALLAALGNLLSGDGLSGDGLGGDGFGGDGGEGPAGQAAALERLAARAREAELPLLALRLELIASYHLRRDGSPAALRRAERNLAEPPAWLDRPEAAEWAAQVAQERALLELAAGRLRSAWQRLQQADEAYLRLAHPKRFTVAMQRADVLARVGAVGEAVRRLRQALDDCRRWPCDPRLEPAVRGTLAWLIGQDPLAGDADLAEAEAIARQALAGIDPTAAPLEHANQRINLAHLRLRAGGDPGAELERARGLLAAGPAGARQRRLAGWASWVEAEGELRRRLPAAALASCRALAREAADAALGDPRLAAAALTCAGRAQRRLGDLAGAAETLERALVLFEHATPGRLGQNIALEPGGRAETFYEAARVAVERGTAGEAWRLLARLDRLILDEEELRACRESAAAGGDTADLQAEIETLRRRLLDQLAALDLPASGPRREQREPVRRALQVRLQELAREAAGCPAAPAPGSSGLGPGYRAMALEDEVIVLRRQAGGTVSLHRRTPLDRRRLVALLARVRAALDGRHLDDLLDDPQWRRLLAPLTPALLPADAEPGEPRRYALHGLLQEVPLEALPLAPGEGRLDRWLGTTYAVARRLAGAGDGSAPPVAAGRALFVVDPARNLASARRLAALYRRLFPQARVLVGAEATRGAVRQALADARWVHFDAHGAFDPAFPGLTRLALADGLLDLGEVSGWRSAPQLANLAGCNTGRWPATADSGRYGLGGLLCRRGARWAIATRTAVSDELAAGFNHAFYQGLAGGRQVPAAFAGALGALSRRHPAAEWSAFQLLDGGGEISGAER